MKFYINPEGVICWNPKGWPEKGQHNTGPSPCGIDYEIIDELNDLYQQALSRAKAESVPVREQDVVYHEICRVESVRNGTVLLDVAIDNIYDVPDSEINKEWL